MFPTERTNRLWHTVVAGYDGTPQARLAVRWAAEQAAIHHCPLHLVRAVESPAAALAATWAPMLVELDENQRHALEADLVAEVDACHARDPALEVHAAMHDGAPSTRLAQHADLLGTGVLVVGSSGRNVLSRLVFGETGAELLRVARRPVVVVRELTPVQQAGMAIGYAPVVAAVDDARTSAHVLGFAFDMAEHWDSGVVVVHPGLPAGHQVPISSLRNPLAGSRRRHSRVPVWVDAVTTGLAPAVLDHSADARLVVVGNHRRHALRRALSGSISHTMLHHAACSVAVVP